MSEIAYLSASNNFEYPKLTLCKPDRTTVSYLKDIYGLKLNIRAGALNEITFTIPVKINKRREIVINPLIDLIKDRFYAKMEFEGQTEYFLFLDRNKQLASDGTTVSYTAYSSGIELADKDLYEYNEVSRTLSTHANDLLTESVWKLGYVESSFDLKFRTLELTSTTLLEGLFKLADNYNALMTFDTINRLVNFYEPNNIVMNRGLQLREGNLLNTLSVSTKSEDLITRLKVYGQDGLEFRSLSPTGSNYLEDFSYFIYPFESDENDNVLKHSDYMSDSLCLALKKYKAKLLANQGRFDTYVNERNMYEDNIVQLNQELSNLNTQLKVLEDEQWVINRTYQDEASSRDDWRDVTERLNIKKSEIENKKTEINLVGAELQIILYTIEQLRIDVITENNLTTEQLLELDTYVLVGTHTNDSIIEVKDLLQEGQDIFNNLNEPPINASIDLEGYVDSIRDKLKPKRISIGDILNVESEELRVKLKLKTISIDIEFDSSSVKLSIANGKDIVDENGKFRKFVADASSTSTVVNHDKFKWGKGEEALNSVSRIINSELDTARNVLVGGYQNTTSISDRGLYSQDYDDPNTYLVINNGLMAITADNGNSVSVAITKNGVVARRLYGNIILGNRLVIEDDSGVITIEDSKMTVFDLNKDERVIVGRYRDPENNNAFKYGLNVKDGAIDIRTSTNENRGVQFDYNGIRAFNNNGVRTFNVNAVTGQVDIVGGISIKSSSSTNRGVVLDGEGIKGYNASGGLAFEISNNGNIFYAGRLDDASGSFVGELKGATGTFNGIVTGTISADSINAVTVDVNQLRANNATITNLSSISADLGNVTAGTITGGVIRGGTISGTSISTDLDSFVGRTLWIGQTYNTGPKSIRFGGSSGGSGISFEGDILELSALGGVRFPDGLRAYGVVDFTNATVIGL